MNQQLQPGPKLFQILLGSKVPERNVEQHDYFFGIGESLHDLVPALKAFWPEDVFHLHIDGWREVTRVKGYAITVCPRNSIPEKGTPKLFFINLGGYQSGKLEEQHYTVLTVGPDRATAIRDAKKTLFFKSNTIKGASAHIDEKYGVDVDDIYSIEDVLSPDIKEKYTISITPTDDELEDEIQLGYFRLDKIRY